MLYESHREYDIPSTPGFTPPLPHVGAFSCRERKNMDDSEARRSNPPSLAFSRTTVQKVNEKY